MNALVIDLTLRVYFFGKFQGVAVRQVGVRGRDGENEAWFSTYELEYHRFDLLLDVSRLVADRDLRQTRQVDQRKVEYCKEVATKCSIIPIALKSQFQNLAST